MISFDEHYHEFNSTEDFKIDIYCDDIHYATVKNIWWYKEGWYRGRITIDEIVDVDRIVYGQFRILFTVKDEGKTRHLEFPNPMICRRKEEHFQAPMQWDCYELIEK